MAPGGGGVVIVSSTANRPNKEYPGFRFTTSFVFLACSVSACGGLMFGYNIGVSGGVTAMSSASFLDMYNKEEQGIASSNDQYCKFDSHKLTFFTSSYLYLTALINADAFHFSMIIYVGRILLGGIIFQLVITIGNIFDANLINYSSNKIEVVDAVPAAIVGLVGSMCHIPDTPNSMIERGVSDENDKKNLQSRPRGGRDLCEPRGAYASEANKLQYQVVDDLLPTPHRDQFHHVLHSDSPPNSRLLKSSRSP
ncbi:hypothetical protein Syun_027314 [Stephania yunnanensis]|uniref:Uncharacterized protein n=1 Tax=Stephania yunnanensis TaxID=152371 RepID=A0AAP0EKV8_9MAGN